MERRLLTQRREEAKAQRKRRGREDTWIIVPEENPVGVACTSLAGHPYGVWCLHGVGRYYKQATPTGFVGRPQSVPGRVMGRIENAVTASGSTPSRVWDDGTD